MSERFFTDEDIEAIRKEHRQRIDAAPVDWPARFRAAAEVAGAAHWYGTADLLHAVASDLTGSATRRTDVVAAIGRELLGGGQ